MKFLVTFISMILVTSLLFSSTVFAHGVESSLDAILQTIVTNQKVNSINDISCSKISDTEFEELGDAVMERMVGDHELHEQMDEMMGGEGSESLTQMHIAMGKNWLNCDGFQGMMGYGGMMGMMPMMMRMMGNYYPAYFNNYDTILTFAIVGWILTIVLFLILVLVFTGKIKIQKRR